MATLERPALTFACQNCGQPLAVDVDYFFNGAGLTCQSCGYEEPDILRGGAR